MTITSFSFRKTPGAARLSNREAVSGDGRRNGFSLIEITIALAIFAFAILAVIGLLSQALNVSGDTRQDSALAILIRTLDAEIRSATTPTAVNSLVNGTRSFDLVGKPVNAADGTAYYQVTFSHSNQGGDSRAKVEELLSLHDASKLNIWSVTIATPSRKTVVLFNNLTLP